jgi:ketosteroid isomerase-like protein
MSEENVEVVRRYYEAVHRVLLAYWDAPRSAADSLRAGDIPPEVAEMMRWLHPNAEWKTALTGVTYRGYEEMTTGFDEMVGAAKDYRVELQEVTDLGGNQILVAAKVGMKGKASEIDVDTMLFVAVTVRDGLITKMDEYLERDEALEAAGLSE